ncbi:MAG: OprO/OprP family phosphate-selective porin [Gammaproteobacteria bacterium]|nr:OprO/OprP family phosphate-selective porin [Gammaproteobacteria bacterium]
MIRKTLLCSSITIILQTLTLSASHAAVSDEDFNQLQSIVKDQSAQISSLQEKLELTADMIDQGGRKSSSATSIGGYGELHYNNLKNQKAGGEDKKQIDMHRAVLFVSHEFNDNIRFWSELEVEHSQAGDGKSGGEVSMEQAYVEFDIHDQLSVRSGMLLIPAGIINETHEPPTFYGVERNPIESKIVPSTWREGGVAVSGRFGTAWGFDAALHSGLSTSIADKYGIRKGRKVARQAPANDLAVTTRLKWTGIPGLELAATAQYQPDVTQGTDASAGSALLTEAHVVWSHGPFAVRGLYATWALEGNGPKSIGANEQTGWYIEPSYKVNSQWGVFTRYNNWDNQAGNSSDSEYAQLDAGVNYWPHPKIVVKADYQRQSTPNGKDNYDGINLGVGYQF